MKYQISQKGEQFFNKCCAKCREIKKQQNNNNNGIFLIFTFALPSRPSLQ